MTDDNFQWLVKLKINFMAPSGLYDLKLVRKKWEH